MFASIKQGRINNKRGSNKGLHRDLIERLCNKKSPYRIKPYSIRIQGFQKTCDKTLKYSRIVSE